MYKKKYRKGEIIPEINELCNQDFIYFHDTILHKTWFRNWQLNFIIGQLNRKTLRYAIKIEEDNDESKIN